MITVGITGGIGSGKSTFAGEWEKLGARVFYADDQAKRLMVSDPVLIRKLKGTFGKDTFLPDGELHREHLIREAFQKGRVEELNALVHPVVKDEFRRFCDQAREDGIELAAYEAALLLKSGRPEELDLVVLLLSHKDVRLERVSRRDETTVAAAEARDRVQPDFETLASDADIVIQNNGSREELTVKAAELYREILSKKQK
ncbi:MAG: dephospho-CoA kinase [Balneolaceae bacterium]|nr:MAG: dephospho-CoA kinase [Balneolaceae bacterium]